MDVQLADNERLDDLMCGGRMLIQNRDIFCFGMDAVLLANFARAGKNDRCMDLCTGNGVIPILMEAKNHGKSFVGVELQKCSADLAKRNVELNHVEDRITIINDDLKNMADVFKGGSFDVVTVNPPYMNENHGLVNPSEPKAIARHEIFCTLEDVITQSSVILKDRGRLYMVHRPQRLVEIMAACTNHKLEPKRIRFVHPYCGKPANMVLLEAVHGGGPQLIVEPPLVMYGDDGKYTNELLKATGQ